VAGDGLTPALYELWPRGPLRFGEHPREPGRARPFPRSDTLFGALCWARAAWRGAAALADWLAPFRAGAPPVLISSGLPLLEEADGPTPLLPLPARLPGAALERKELRGVEYLAPQLLPWLGGAGEAARRRRGGALLAGAPRADEEGELWTVRRRPRVAIDRAGSTPNLFESAQAWTRRAAGRRVGAAVLVLARGGEALDELEVCLDLLGRVGIGGERSVGGGGFDWRRAPSPLPLAAEPRGMALSLVCPSAAEVAAGALAPGDGRGYRLVERSGWIASPAWQGARGRPVAMLAEGSYLAPSLPAPVGRLVDVTPPGAGSDQHPVYRYGLGLFLDEGLT